MEMTMPTGDLTPALQEFFDCWKGACQHGDIPERAAIRPDIFPRQSLGFLTYQEYVSHGVLLWKIAGTALVDAFGMEVAGLNALDMLPPDGLENDIATVEIAMAHPCGIIYVLAFKSEYAEPILYRILQLPVRGDDGTVNRFVGMAEPYIRAPNLSEGDLGHAAARRGEGGLVDVGFGLPDINTELSKWIKPSPTL